jgi:hypothetical protein
MAGVGPAITDLLVCETFERLLGYLVVREIRGDT